MAAECPFRYGKVRRHAHLYTDRRIFGPRRCADSTRRARISSRIPIPNRIRPRADRGLSGYSASLAAFTPGAFGVHVPSALAVLGRHVRPVRLRLASAACDCRSWSRPTALGLSGPDGRRHLAFFARPQHGGWAAVARPSCPFDRCRRGSLYRPAVARSDPGSEVGLFPTVSRWLDRRAVHAAPHRPFGVSLGFGWGRSERIVRFDLTISCDYMGESRRNETLVRSVTLDP